MTRNCETCDTEIPAQRLAALPDATTCVKCSDTEKVTGYLIWDGKHSPSLQLGKEPHTRRNFNASIGANSYKNPRLISTQDDNNLSLQIREERPGEERNLEVVNRNPARCHPDRPRMNVAGHCLECALALQKARIR